MEEPRQLQICKRTGSSGTLMSAGSATAMEVKRKKIVRSALFHQTESADVQEKLDFETRMREGAYKLLLACSQREQVLDASKNLLTCNARIKAYLTQLRKEAEEPRATAAAGRDPVSDERLACGATVAVSGLRIPMMWRDSDHFNNRGSSRRVAVFCLLQMGPRVFDTQMTVVDRSVTDVCFEGTSVFKDALPDFELRVELWSCALDEDLTLANTPKKLAKKLRTSLGRSSGKKLCPLLDSPDPDTFLQHNPIPAGAKYSLLAYTTLRLPEAEGSFLSHSLVVLQNDACSSWLPLYGNLCCKLVAQPVCMTLGVMSGYLSQAKSVEGMKHSCRLYCVLSAGVLSCYFTPEEIEAKVPPTLRVAIDKDTRIRVIEKESSGQKSRRLSVINPSPDGSETLIFSTDTSDELEDWLDALHQHLFDQSQWLHCCNQLMKIEVVSPRKPSLFLTKQADSVYNDLSINSPGRFEGLTDIIHSKIEETGGRFLIGDEQEKEVADWSTLFDGSRPLVVQKSLLSESKTSTPYSSPVSTSAPNSAKKRRAPPPPASRQPHAPPTSPARPPPPASRRPPPPPPPYQEKENCVSRPATRSKTGRPSLDAKFSAIIQQLQRNNAGGSGAAGRRNAPLGVVEVRTPGHPQQLDPQGDEASGEQRFFRPGLGSAPVPTPRSKLRKSFRERMNLKSQ